MVFLWITETVDLPVTGLIPLLLFPTLGLQSLDKTAAYYSSPVIYLFLAGMILGIGIEKSNLHRRFALFLISIVGTSGNRILLSFIICTGFISMWISNTAATLMMLPLAMSIIAIFSNHKEGNFNNFKMSLLLSVAYASNFGGLATLIGSPPNLVMAGYIEKTYQYEISFLEWMSIGAPISAMLLCMLYFVMTFKLPNHLNADTNLTENIKRQRANLGKISDTEFKTLIIFSFVVFFWIFGSLLQKYLPFKINDTSIAIAGAISLFVVSSNKKCLLDWQDTKEIPWGVLLMFGGGLALAGALEENKVLEVISNFSNSLTNLPYSAIIFALILFSIFSSELLNNISQVIIFLPIACSLASNLKYDPLTFAYALTIAAGSASMLPTGTPPNAIVFASGSVPMKQMLNIGFILNIISTLIIGLVFLCLIKIKS